MGSRSLVVSVASVGLCLALSGSAGAAAGKTVVVDCAKGQSVNEALANKAEPLVVEIRGTCVEDVAVRRDGVTLRGRSAASDGIRAADPADPAGLALLIDDADRVVVENLTISGGGRGVSLQEAGPSVVVRNCRIEDNGRFGVAAFHSVIHLEDVVVTGNGGACAGAGGTGILSFAGTSLTCLRCTVAGCDVGVSASTSSSATVTDSTLAGDPAIQASVSGRAFARDSQLTGHPVAAGSINQGQLTLVGGTFAGSLLADAKSLLLLRRSPGGPGPEQTANSLANRVSGDSLLDAAPQSILVGLTTLDLFSHALLRGTSLEGLSCGYGSDALCQGGTTFTSSTCAGCPPPPP
jgi:hypothetical protein